MQLRELLGKCRLKLAASNILIKIITTRIRNQAFVQGMDLAHEIVIAAIFLPKSLSAFRVIGQTIGFADLDIRLPQTNTTLPTRLWEHTFETAHTEPIPTNRLVLMLQDTTFHAQHFNSLRSAVNYQWSRIPFTYLVTIKIHLIFMKSRQSVFVDKGLYL